MTDEGFYEFVTARSPALLRTAYLLLGDRALAEEVVDVAEHPDGSSGGGHVQQVPLRHGRAFVVPEAKPLTVRACDQDGNLVAEQVPNNGLLRP